MTTENYIKKIVVRNAMKTGDGECGYLEVSEESYREAVGEEKYQEELDWKLRNIEWAQTEYEDALKGVPTEGLIEYAKEEVERTKKWRHIWSIYLENIIWALDLEDDDVFDIEITLLKKEKDNKEL